MIPQIQCKPTPNIWEGRYGLADEDRIFIADETGVVLWEDRDPSELGGEAEAEDMPLHSAAYDPTRDKIFAVRGGRVFKLNADTGAKESESQYAGPTLSDSYIAYDAGRDKLWVTYSPNFNAPPGLVGPVNDKYIFKLNPDTFAIEQTIGLHVALVELGLVDNYLCNHVVRNLIVNGVQLAYWINGAANNGGGMVVFDPDNLPFELFTQTQSVARWGFLAVHPSGDYLWSSDDNYNEGVERRTNANGFVSNSGGYPVIEDEDNTKRIYGFAYVATGDLIYAANRSNLILRLPASTTTVGTAIDVGATDIWNIRRNPNNGLLYAADFGGNQIVVIDPSDDSFTLKTGFDAPWDVVFTGSKAFAVQHGALGLKEIV